MVRERPTLFIGVRVLPATAAALLACLALAGCGGQSQKPAAAAHAAVPATCPQAWRAGWQRIANEAGATVYCPTWMPKPLDARIGGPYTNVTGVDKHDRSYLVSFVWVEHDLGGVTGEVHVNFRGYPGRTAIPTCEDTVVVKGKTLHPKLPCFSDPKGTRRLAGLDPTLYTVNQGIDQWHLLYAWRRHGTLYTVSQHVTPPYSYSQVLRSLDRMTRGLVEVAPTEVSATGGSREAFCRGSQLAARFAVIPGSGAAGSIGYRLSLKNTSTAACALSGLPQGRLLDRRGRALPTNVRTAFPGALTAVLVRLAPGQSAHATARFSPDVPGVGEGGRARCEPVAYSFRVTAPAGGTTKAPVKPPTSVCEHGRLLFSAYGR
jgi:hypothetical protein